MPHELYRNPELYSWAFSHRDFVREVDAILGWYQRHGGTVRKPRRVLELGAGPADHAIELCRRGVDVTALDSSPEMRRAANEAARARGLELTVIDGDLTEFSASGRFDLALCLGDTSAHLHSLDDLVAHVRCVARHLRSRGLLVLEAAHPADFMGSNPRTQQAWQVSRDGRRLRVRWGGKGDRFDPVTQLEHTTVTLTTAGSVVRHELVLRRWTPTEFDAAARLSGGVGVAALYGGYDGEDVADTNASRLIAVLRKEQRR